MAFWRKFDVFVHTKTYTLVFRPGRILTDNVIPPPAQ